MRAVIKDVDSNKRDKQVKELQIDDEGERLAIFRKKPCGGFLSNS